MGWGLPGILKLLPSPTVVPEDHLQATLERLPADAVVLDVGAGGRRILPTVTTVDAVEAPGVDVVGNIHDLPIEDNHADCVVCTGTLEHVADPFQAVKELRRVLKPGGWVHIDVPFMQGYHADPTDYWRFTIDGLRHMCRDFEHVDSGVQIGPSCGLVWVAREWAESWSSSRLLSNALLATTAVVSAPLRYCDYLLVHRPGAHRVASAVYFRGRKPEPHAEA